MTGARKPLDLSRFEGATEGPWDVWIHDDPTRMYPITGADPFAPIAMVGGKGAPNKTNARLMAAAPELRSEVERLRGLLGESRAWIAGKEALEANEWGSEIAPPSILARIDAALGEVSGR